MKYKVDDEVITKVTKGDVPSGTFGVVDSVEGKDIWVAVYIPADDDVPYDYIRYDEDQIEFPCHFRMQSRTGGRRKYMKWRSVNE